LAPVPPTEQVAFGYPSEPCVESVAPLPPVQWPKLTEPGETVIDRMVGTTFTCPVTCELPEDCDPS